MALPIRNQILHSKQNFKVTKIIPIDTGINTVFSSKITKQLRLAELLKGIEPSTSSLPRKCSTPELQQLVLVVGSSLLVVSF
jgi:hypothetical protein